MEQSLTRRDWLALLFAMTFPSVATWLYFVVLADSPPWVQLPIYSICKTVQFGLPLFWIIVVQKQRARLLRFQKRGIAVGAGFGLAILLAMLGLYYGYLKESSYLAEAPKAVWAKISGFGCDTPAKFLVMALFIAAIHSFLEEYYWRWFVFGQLRRGIRMWIAIILSSLAFAAHHVIVISAYLQPEHFWTATIFFSVCVAAGGAVWAWIYHRTESLYAPWLSHLFIDAGLMWIGFDLCRSSFYPT